MKPIVKTILKVAEGVATATIPGAGMVDAAVHGIADKSKPKDEAVLDIAQGAIQAVEAIKEAEIADEVQFRAGIATLEAGFKLVRASLRHAPASGQ